MAEQDKTFKQFLDHYNEVIEDGSLYVVSTPIGNLADISIRALHILTRVDLIAAEDTRHTGSLLAHFGIKSQLQSYHEHNAQKVLPFLIDKMKSGSSLAIVTDAGTPGVSDPGYRLVHESIENGIRVIAVPGANALLAALVPSGLGTDRFTFEGFLPRKKGRQTRLKELVDETRTMVFYESPNRIAKTVSELSLKFGKDRKAVICRELTKNYEEYIRGTLEELEKKLSEKSVKGEIVLVVEGKSNRKKREENKESKNKYANFPVPGEEDNEKVKKLSFPGYEKSHGR